MRMPGVAAGRRHRASLPRSRESRWVTSTTRPKSSTGSPKPSEALLDQTGCRPVPGGSGKDRRSRAFITTVCRRPVAAARGSDCDASPRSPAASPPLGRRGLHRKRSPTPQGLRHSSPHAHHPTPANLPGPYAHAPSPVAIVRTSPARWRVERLRQRGARPVAFERRRLQTQLSEAGRFT